MVDIEPELRCRVADVVRVHGPRHVERHGAHLSTTQLRTLDGISRCPTASMGAPAAIDSCGHQVIAYNSCRTRGCTNCGRHLLAEWVENFCFRCEQCRRYFAAKCSPTCADQELRYRRCRVASVGRAQRWLSDAAVDGLDLESSG